MKDLARHVRLFLLYNCGSLGLLALLVLTGAADRTNPRFVELDAERINIIGTNGKPVLVLSNRRLIPGPSMNGKDYPPAVADGRDLVSGMIFFNEQGDEVGGLIFNGFPKESGYSSVGHLSFDQWKQNQVVALQYIDSGKSRRAGLNVWDRSTEVSMDTQLDRAVRMIGATEEERERLRKESEAARERGEYGVQRIFVGSRDRTAEVLLRDTKGRPRARLFVDDTDAARLEFLDEGGKVIATYPAGR